LLSTNGKGMSSVQIAKQVGVTQPTAWFMCHRIRSVKELIQKTA
jgi:phage major head subunit gpT-like protein